MRDMGLLHIQRELQFAFEEPAACFTYCLGMFASPLDHDHKVIFIEKFRPDLLFAPEPRQAHWADHCNAVTNPRISE
jgi:hypothetical protein